MVLSKKAFIILLFLANISTVSTMEIETWRQKSAQRRIETILNHIKPDNNDLRGEIMNNTTHSTFYALLAAMAIVTGTTEAMEHMPTTEKNQGLVKIQTTPREEVFVQLKRLINEPLSFEKKETKIRLTTIQLTGKNELNNETHKEQTDNIWKILDNHLYKQTDSNTTETELKKYIKSIESASITHYPMLFQKVTQTNKIIPKNIGQNNSYYNPENDIKKIVIRNQLKKFATQYRNNKNEQTISNLKEYLNLLIEYRKFVTNKKNSKEIDETIALVNQQIEEAIQKDLSHAIILNDEDNNLQSPTQKELAKILNQSTIFEASPPQTTNHVYVKEESNISIEQQSASIIDEPAIYTDESNFNNLDGLNELRADSGQSTFSTPIREAIVVFTQITENNIQDNNVIEQNVSHLNNSNQRRLSTGENTSSIEPNNVKTELPIQPPSSSSMIDALTQEIDPDKKPVVLQAVHAHYYGGEKPLSSEEESSDESQEENTNNSSNIWTSINNTLINSLASLWSSLCTIFAWFKFW